MEASPLVRSVGSARMSVRTRQGEIATPVRPRLPRGCDQLFLRVRTTRAKACADRRRKDPQRARDPQPSYVPKRARARNFRRPPEPPTAACQSSFRRRYSARLRLDRQLLSQRRERATHRRRVSDGKLTPRGSRRWTFRAGRADSGWSSRSRRAPGCRARWRGRPHAGGRGCRASGAESAARLGAH
jgi:hypothetical protein